jgi:hypothetical protein
MNEWQPIETAPKDGTHILAWVPWTRYPKTLFWAIYADEWRCPASERGPCEDGWQPTHWMPAPAPPQEEKRHLTAAERYDDLLLRIVQTIGLGQAIELRMGSGHGFCVRGPRHQVWEMLRKECIAAIEAAENFLRNQS